MKILRWVFLNGCVLGSFIAGQFFGIEWAMNIALFMLWLTAIIGSIFVFVPKGTMNEVMKSSKISFPVPFWADVTYDAVMLLLIASQGMFVLGVFYFLHIIGLKNVRDYISRVVESEES